MAAAGPDCNQNAILSKRVIGEGGVCSCCLVDFPAGLITHGSERLCPLCDAPHHLEFGRGTMIWLPSMSQAALNIMCLVVFCGIYASKQSGNNEMLNRFVDLVEDLERLALVLENNYLGELRNSFSEGSNPLWFAQAIDHISKKQDGSVQPSLDGVRFLPDYAFFVPHLKLWFERFLQSNPLDSWRVTAADGDASLNYQV